MQRPDVLAAPQPLIWPRTIPRLRLRLSASAVTLGFAFAAYLLLGALLALGPHSIIGDAWSRVGNAYYVLFSRDPHLAAVGFVWNPLPSLLMLPLLPFGFLFPPLIHEGLAANILSAAFMAGAVVQVLGTAKDFSLPTPARIGVALLFALHPLIVHYGANGMSEAAFVFFLVLVARHLARWTTDRSLSALVRVGIYLALAYLTRYEAAIAAAGVAIVVAGITWSATAGAARARATTAVADLLIVMTPFVVCFAGWAAASWLITGSPFEQFSSAYGIASQVGWAGSAGAGSPVSSSSATAFALAQMTGLAPLLLPVIIISAACMVILRDPRALAILVPMGAILVFEVWAYETGRTAGWLRYYIVSAPLLVMLVTATMSALLGRARGLRAVRRGRRGVTHEAQEAAIGFGFTVIVVVGLLTLSTSIPAAAATMMSTRLGTGESAQLAFLTSKAEYTGGQAYLAGGRTARYLDGLQLDNGRVLIDAALGFPIVLQSDRPRQFIITSDRDFTRALADPAAFGVRYIVVPKNSGYATLDALNRAYPMLYADGAGFGPLAFDSDLWRVYQVDAR